MKTILVICCIVAFGDALSVLLPVKDYLTKLDDRVERPVQLVDLVSDEERLLSERVGRQYYDKRIPISGNAGLQTQNYGGYAVNGYNNYYTSYPNNNRRNYQIRRRKFGGIGSAIIV